MKTKEQYLAEIDAAVQQLVISALRERLAATLVELEASKAPVEPAS